MRTKIFTLLLLIGLSSCSSAEKTESEKKRPVFYDVVNAQTFYKGNLHTHSNKSDGDISPEKVVQWYQKYGYSFLALTDHDMLVSAKSVKNKEFVLLNGVEITSTAAKNTPVHINAICGKSSLKGINSEKSTHETINASVRISNQDGAISILNHPNYKWAISKSDLLASDGFEMIEIASGSPVSKHAGDDSHPAAEELWDYYMTDKHRVFGVAVDDAHNYSKFAETELNPGRAWIQLWAPQLTSDAICTALRNGHFYSSTGTKLKALVVSPNTVEVAVDGWNAARDYVDFIGARGEMLDRVFTNPARYVLRGGEGYVRAHVTQKSSDPNKNDRHAWTQAYFIKYE